MRSNPLPLREGAGGGGGRHQRAVGELGISVRRRNGTTALADLRQAGCLKARFPRPESGAWTTAVTLNTSGGIASGDVLSTTIEVQTNACLTLAGQAAERIYRTPPGGDAATVRNRIVVGPGAAAEWLPQDCILFDGSALDRTLDIELAAHAWFLGVEALVFGRTLMGERVARGTLRDTLRIRRDGTLLLHDAIRLDGGIDSALGGAAIAKGGCAVATLVLVAPDSASLLDPLRDALASTGADAGASAWDGLLLARIVAGRQDCLRAAIVAGLAALRASRPLPRVWLC